MNKTDLSPLSWSITFFSMWYTIISLKKEGYNWFAWLLFGFSVILLATVYCRWLYDNFNSIRFVNIILPTIFEVTVAGFIIGVIQVLKDLTSINQWVALISSFVLIGSMIMCWIAKWPKLRARIIACIVIALLFFFMLVKSGFMGSWPVLIILAQTIWGTLQPSKFEKIPVV